MAAEPPADPVLRLVFAGDLKDTGANAPKSDGVAVGGVGQFVADGVPGDAVGSNGTALLFDGRDDTIAFPDKTGREGELLFQGTQPFTVFVRLRFNDLEGIQHVFSRWPFGHSLFLQGRLAFALRATAPRRFVGCTLPIEAGVWYDVACVYSGPGEDNMSIYLHDTSSGKLLEHESATLDTTVDAGTPAVSVGSRGGVDFFHGAMESVMAFNRALSPQEVHALTTNVPWTSGAVLKERFSAPVPLSHGETGVLAPFAGSATARDWDGDGHLDLVARNSLWRSSGQIDENGLPIFEARVSVKLPGTALGDLDGDGDADCVAAHRQGFSWYVNTGSDTAPRFGEPAELRHPLGRPIPLPETGESVPLVALADWDGDGRTDMISATRAVGIGKYLPSKGPGFKRGWADGTWYFRDMTATVFLHRNVGSAGEPCFTDGRLLTTGNAERAITFFDTAVPVPVDWDADGLLDLLIGTFDRVVVFLNKGSRTMPALDDGHLVRFDGAPTTTFERRAVFPFRGPDGLWRLNIGGSMVRQTKQLAAGDLFSFGPLHLLRCRTHALRLANFSVPAVADWNGDGKPDLVVGTEDGFVWFVANRHPQGGASDWAAPAMLMADGKPIRPVNIKHLQGPCEWWWGYTNPRVVDWDLDGDLDLILGYVGESYLYYENTGSSTEPVLSARGHLRCGGPDEADADVSVAWRTRPGAGDLDGDGLPDLVGVDGEGRLCWWRRTRTPDGALRLGPPRRPVDSDGGSFVTSGTVRATGRTKLVVCDWDHDGKPDIIASPQVHARGGYQLFYRSLGLRDGRLVLELQRRRIRTEASGHYTMCEPIDVDRDGKWEIIAGRDAGHLHFWPERE